MEGGKVKKKKKERKNQRQIYTTRWSSNIFCAKTQKSCATRVRKNPIWKVKSDDVQDIRGRNEPQRLLTLVHQRANMSLEPRRWKEAKTLSRISSLSSANRQISPPNQLLFNYRRSFDHFAARFRTSGAIIARRRLYGDERTRAMEAQITPRQWDMWRWINESMAPTVWQHVGLSATAKPDLVRGFVVRDTIGGCGVTLLRPHNDTGLNLGGYNEYCTRTLSHNRKGKIFICYVAGSVPE